ncbi:DUF3606 domain-containing protein [Mesorhizobium sp.]|uniref:DUF3606 domain-containing protein n=1 Tax=Mesorhizobium sp. TaxID=1871066 RepID=UPI00120AEC3A|nr:DUF3606 domain-containing protein [Mesorhizobium sp.]TIS94510.1 MAG: DUF3606 domain-containing protein [Mesorhizobium sp.]
MADDKSKATEDLWLASSSEESYQVAEFAEKYGFPESEAALIIERKGSSKKKLDAYMASRKT